MSPSSSISSILNIYNELETLVFWTGAKSVLGVPLNIKKNI